MRSLIVFFQPLCCVWLLLGGWVAFACWHRRWRTVAIPATAWFILTALTCTPLASFLISSLENSHARVAINDLAAADVIVCLGGGAEPSGAEPSGFHLKPSGDRLTTALVLLAQQKAPLLVLGGGGYADKDEMLSEADRVVEMTRSLTGIRHSILSLGICADTRDEALKMAALTQEKGWKRVLLVTSAYHMPRAAATFHKIGIPIVAVPCNYLSSTNRVGSLHWLHLPHPEGLSIFDTWLHEMLGTWFYSGKGWI
jgi:uncharacterized SAM-binding protein YcdF (DUF218 family)